MIRALQTNGKQRTVTQLSDASIIQAQHIGGLREAPIPHGFRSVAVQQRRDGRWYAEAQKHVGTGDTPYEAVVHAFGGSGA